jgi:hypothetical protein
VNPARSASACAAKRHDTVAMHASTERCRSSATPSAIPPMLGMREIASTASATAIPR